MDTLWGWSWRMTPTSHGPLWSMQRKGELCFIYFGVGMDIWHSNTNQKITVWPLTYTLAVGISLQNFLSWVWNERWCMILMIMSYFTWLSCNCCLWICGQNSFPTLAFCQYPFFLLLSFDGTFFKIIKSNCQHFWQSWSLPGLRLISCHSEAVLNYNVS